MQLQETGQSQCRDQGARTELPRPYEGEESKQPKLGNSKRKSSCTSTPPETEQRTFLFRKERRWGHSNRPQVPSLSQGSLVPRCLLRVPEKSLALSPRLCPGHKASGFSYVWSQSPFHSLPSYLLLSFATFPNSSFWRQPIRSLMQKVTRALNTAMKRPGCTHGIENTTDSLDARVPPSSPDSLDARVPSSSPAWMPGSPQLTSTVRDLEFVGLSTFPVPLGGGHSCSERLYHFMEQLWSEALLKEQEYQGRQGSQDCTGQSGNGGPRERHPHPQTQGRGGGGPQSPIRITKMETKSRILWEGEGVWLRSPRERAGGSRSCTMATSRWYLELSLSLSLEKPLREAQKDPSSPSQQRHRQSIPPIVGQILGSQEPTEPLESTQR